MEEKKKKPKTGGRQKGTTNKDKRLFRETMELKIGSSIPERLATIAVMDEPEDQIKREKWERRINRELRILLEALPYCYPKMAPILIAAPLSAEEEALRQRQYAYLSQSLDDDPNPSRAN